MLHKCMANMRQIGHAIMAYESSYPDASGYGVEELARSGEFTAQACPSIQCPLDTTEEAGGAPRFRSAYVLLPGLQPYHMLQDPANTVVAFDLHTHVWTSGRSEYAAVVLLYADGHVDDPWPMDAQKEITRSLMARPATRPASTQPIQ